MSQPIRALQSTVLGYSFGPFEAEVKRTAGSGSIEPAVFSDDDGLIHPCVGGLMAGQLDNWRAGSFDANVAAPSGNEAALGPRVGKLSDDMMSYAGPIAEVKLNDANSIEFGGNWCLFPHDGSYASGVTRRR